MRKLILVLLACSGVAGASPEETLEALTSSESQDLSAWRALAAEAAEAGDTSTAERATARVLEIEKQRFPCLHDARFRDFDFWLGSWDVRIADGTFAGTNHIQRSEQGCVLIEKWSSAGGGTGHSINYLDGDSGEWVQLWNDASGSQIDIRGSLEPEGMRLTGTIHYLATGTTAPFRGLWTPLPDGRVRQFFEQSNDNGESWTPWFEGFYSRAEQQEESQD